MSINHNVATTIKGNNRREKRRRESGIVKSFAFAMIGYRKQSEKRKRLRNSMKRI